MQVTCGQEARFGVGRVPVTSALGAIRRITVRRVSVRFRASLGFIGSSSPARFT